MLSKIFFILTLICLTSCKRMPEVSKWDVTVTNMDGTSDIKIYKGKYTQLLLTLTLQEEEESTFEHKGKHGYVPSHTVIQLKQDNTTSFKTSHKTYIIDTSDSATYSIYLGVSCNDSLEPGVYSLSFEEIGFNVLQRFLTFTPFNVEFIVDTTLNIIDITPIQKELPVNSKSLFKLNSELTNVDDISIKFTSDEENELSYVKSFEFKALTEERGFFVKSSYNGFIGEYGVYEYNENNTLHSYKIVIDNKCYSTSLGETFEFSTSNEEVVILNKADIVKSFKQIESEDDDAIEVSLSLPAPVIVYAALTSDDVFDNMKDIIDFKENKKVKYTKYFITEPTDSFILKFSELGRRTKYRLMLIIQNTSIEENANYITVTVGHFKGADIVMSLYPKYVNEFPAQCATWTFENETPSTFAELAEQYCAYTFNGKVSNEKDFFKSCTKCKSITPINKNKNQAVICVYYKDRCYTKFEGDAVEIFKGFVESINTQQKINETLSIENATVVSTNIEIDNKEPDTAKIKAVLDSKVYKKVLKFNVTSELDQAIECNYKRNLDRTIRRRWIGPENLKERSLIINPHETTEFEVFLPHVKPDNKTYNIYLDCYYLPNFDYQFFSTGAFVAGTFLYTDIKEKEYPKVKKINCTKRENKSKPQCIEQEPNNNITFESSVPEIYETASDDADDLTRLSYGNQNIMLDIALQRFYKALPRTRSLISAEEILKAINETLNLIKQMESIDCKLIPYEECRTMKKLIQKQVVAFIKQFFDCTNIIPLFNKLKEVSDYEEVLKTFMLLIESAIKNSNAMNEGDTEYFTSIINCIVDNFNNIWADFTQTVSKTEEELQKIKNDLTQSMLDAIANLASANQFDELDGYIKDKLSKGKMLINEKTKQIRENIKAIAQMLWENGEGKYETDNIILNITINLEEKANKRLRYLEEEKITILEFETFGIKIGLKVNSLITLKKAKYLEIILYKNYPLRSAKNDVVSKKFISITLYDKNKKEITVEDLMEDLLPEIYFDINEFKVPHCVYYNEKNEELQDDGISSAKLDGYFVCKVKHFTDFSIADDSVFNGGLAWWGIMLIVVIVIILIGVGFLFWRKMSGKGIRIGSNDYLKA